MAHGPQNGRGKEMRCLRVNTIVQVLLGSWHVATSVRSTMASRLSIKPFLLGQVVVLLSYMQCTDRIRGIQMQRNSWGIGVSRFPTTTRPRPDQDPTRPLVPDHDPTRLATMTRPQPDPTRHWCIPLSCHETNHLRFIEQCSCRLSKTSLY